MSLPRAVAQAHWMLFVQFGSAEAVCVLRIDMPKLPALMTGAFLSVLTLGSGLLLV